MEVFDQLAAEYRGEHSTNPFQAALVERNSAPLPGGTPGRLEPGSLDRYALARQRP